MSTVSRIILSSRRTAEEAARIEIFSPPCGDSFRGSFGLGDELWHGVGGEESGALFDGNFARNTCPDRQKAAHELLDVTCISAPGVLGFPLNLLSRVVHRQAAVNEFAIADGCHLMR